MMTAFFMQTGVRTQPALSIISLSWTGSPTCIVTARKYAMSLDNRQGSVPCDPMPFRKLAATMAVSGSGPSGDVPPAARMSNTTATL